MPITVLCGFPVEEPEQTTTPAQQETGGLHQISELCQLRGCSVCHRALSTCAMGAIAVVVGLPMERRVVVLGTRRAHRLLSTLQSHHCFLNTN